MRLLAHETFLGVLGHVGATLVARSRICVRKGPFRERKKFDRPACLLHDAKYTIATRIKIKGDFV